jgi:hypothetical protein
MIESGDSVRHTTSGDVGTVQGKPHQAENGRWWAGVRFGPGHEAPPQVDGPVWGYDRATRSWVPGRYSWNVLVDELEPC